MAHLPIDSRCPFARRIHARSAASVKPTSQPGRTNIALQFAGTWTGVSPGPTAAKTRTYSPSPTPGFCFDNWTHSSMTARAVTTAVIARTTVQSSVIQSLSPMSFPFDAHGYSEGLFNVWVSRHIAGVPRDSDPCGPPKWTNNSCRGFIDIAVDCQPRDVDLARHQLGEQQVAHLSQPVIRSIK